MDSQVLEPKKQEIEDFIQGNPDAREVKRALAVKWSLSGISYRQIRKLLNLKHLISGLTHFYWWPEPKFNHV